MSGATAINRTALFSQPRSLVSRDMTLYEVADCMAECTECGSCWAIRQLENAIRLGKQPRATHSASLDLDQLLTLCISCLELIRLY